MTRDQYIDGIATAALRAVQQRESLSARQAAEGAWYPGHPLGTVDAIEAAIIRRRAEDATLIAQRATGHRTAA